MRRLRRAVGLDQSVARSPGGAAPGEPGGVGVLISGDAGIGKSRLVAEIVHEATQAGWLVATGHCVGLGEAVLAYLPFTELLTTLAELAPEAVGRTMATRPELAVLLPTHRAGGDGSGASVPTDQAAAAPDPARVAEAVHACLVAAGSGRRLLVVVEDVHWADHSSRELLTLLFTRGLTSRVTLLVTYRSDDLHRRHPLHETLPVWTRIAGLDRLELAPLRPGPMRALVAALDGAPTDHDGVREVIERAEGNAFFAEEIVASRQATGARAADLTRLLLARVDSLGDDARTVVRAAATAGRTVEHTLLAEVCRLDPDALDAALREAIEHHLVEPVGDGYTFRHALLAEAIAEDLLPGTRRRLHTAYLAALQADPRLGSPADLARHAAAVGDPATASRASVAAGDAALAVGGPRDAMRHYDRALLWCSDRGDRARIALRAAHAATIAGEQVRAVELLRDALETTDGSTHPGERADLLADLALQLRALSLPGDPLALAREAHALLPATRDQRRATVLFAMLQSLVDAGCAEEALAVSDELAALADELGLPGVAAEARVVLSTASGTDEALATAIRTLERLVADLEGTDDPAQVWARMRLGGLASHRGRIAEALEHYEQGYAVGSRLRGRWAPYVIECRLYGGVMAYQLGEWDRAATLFDLGDEGVIPQPGGALVTAAGLLLVAGRGDPVPPGVWAELRPWWPVDVLVAAYALYAAIDLLGAAGELTALLDLTDECLALLEHGWSPDFQGVIRVAALLAGQAAAHRESTPEPLPDRLIDTIDRYAARARSRLAAPVGPHHPAPGPESLAWGSRLEAELLRLARASDAAAAPADAAYVDAWERAVAGFEAIGHRPEAARSRVHLAAALRAVGRDADGDVVAAAALEVAERLGARPLITALGGVVPVDEQSGARRPDDAPRAVRRASTEPTQLTPREHEVLTLVAEGRTNGQIGRALFISTKTVSVHVSNVLAKLGAINRAEAAAIARRQGLLGD